MEAALIKVVLAFAAASVVCAVILPCLSRMSATTARTGGESPQGTGDLAAEGEALPPMPPVRDPDCKLRVLTG